MSSLIIRCRRCQGLGKEIRDSYEKCRECRGTGTVCEEKPLQAILDAIEDVRYLLEKMVRK